MTYQVQNPKWSLMHRSAGKESIKYWENPSDASRLKQFFQKWRLRPNPSKIMLATFHLNIRRKPISQYLSIFVSKKKTKSHPCTFSLDWTFKTHLHKVSAKLKTRIGLINKLAWTTWGAATRTSFLALAYSITEYYAPVWAGSAHTEVVEIQLRKH